MAMGFSASPIAQPKNGAHKISFFSTQVVCGNHVTCQSVSSVDVCLIMTTEGVSGMFSRPSTSMWIPQKNLAPQSARRHQLTHMYQ
jgi:hypothetical protein